MNLILIIFGIILIIVNSIKIKNEGNNFNSKLKQKTNDVTEFDMKLTKAKSEIYSEIISLQNEIDELKKMVNNTDKIVECIKDYSSLKENEEVIKTNQDVEISNNDTNKNIQISEINKLINENYTVDEIAEKLGIGKGEVLLIKNLYLK